MPSLNTKTRATLKDSAFAYIDSQGRRRLPIHDAAHVRNALARFEQVAFEDDRARERARVKLLRAAKKHGIVPLGFFDGQIRKERAAVQTRARTAEMSRWPRGSVTFLFTDRARPRFCGAWATATPRSSATSARSSAAA